jgi:peptide deformylase
MKKWQPALPPFAKFKSRTLKSLAKTSSFIYSLGESPILREKSKEVPVKDIRSPGMQMKFKYLKDCILRYRKLTGFGRGLTAVQVGIAERFSVVYTPDRKLMMIINPKITQVSKSKLKYPEVCMSFMPVIVPVTRPSWIEFDYYDTNGNLRHWQEKDDTGKGKILNRLFQHEFDHMDGIFNIDRVESAKELILDVDPDYYDNAAFVEIA